MANMFKTQVTFFKYFLKILSFVFYTVCWSLTHTLDMILNIFLGKFHSSSKTAQLGHILYRMKSAEMQYSLPQDFACMFYTRVAPDYVLRPNVSLYVTTKTEAIFVETPENVNIYSSDVHPFFLLAQFHYAKKVIKMPIRVFVNLSDNVGDRAVPVVWLSNTGRCGGTLLCQMFESVPGTLVMHEPGPPSNIYYLHEYNRLSDTEYETLLKSTIRILCKPHPGIIRMVIKPRPHCVIMMRDISKTFPDIKQLFIYRNSLDTISSFLAIMTYDVGAVVTRICIDTGWFNKICPLFIKILSKYLAAKLKDSPEMPLDSTVASAFAYAWANFVLIARDAKEHGVNFLPVKYEDLVLQPLENTTHIFEQCGIDAVYVDLAVSTFSRDSQRGSPLSREKIGDDSNRHISKEDKIKCDAILSGYKLPLMGEEFRL